MVRKTRKSKPETPRDPYSQAFDIVCELFHANKNNSLNRKQISRAILCEPGLQVLQVGETIDDLLRHFEEDYLIRRVYGKEGKHQVPHYIPYEERRFGNIFQLEWQKLVYENSQR